MPETTRTTPRTLSNPLYPVFLKLDQMELLIVGAGSVGYEKLFFILKSSPNARITVVAKEFSQEVRTLLEQYPGIQAVYRAFHPVDVEGKQLVIAATESRTTNMRIRDAAKVRNCLVNVADTPDLCDFYLGSIVTRGDLKVAISTNGKSPTFAKRFRQMLEEILPEDTALLLTHLREIRDHLSGDFPAKVKYLNDLTASLLPGQEATQSSRWFRMRRVRKKNRLSR